jgi:hypothetical protein
METFARIYEERSAMEAQLRKPENYLCRPSFDQLTAALPPGAPDDMPLIS